MIEAFEEAFRELERAMDDVATATIRANNCLLYTSPSPRD